MFKLTDKHMPTLRLDPRESLRLASTTFTMGVAGFIVAVLSSAPYSWEFVNRGLERLPNTWWLPVLLSLVLWSIAIKLAPRRLAVAEWFGLFAVLSLLSFSFLWVYGFLVPGSSNGSRILAGFVVVGFIGTLLALSAWVSTTVLRRIAGTKGR